MNYNVGDTAALIASIGGIPVMFAFAFLLYSYGKTQMEECRKNRIYNDERLEELRSKKLRSVA